MPYAEITVAGVIVILLGLIVYAFRKIGKLRGDQAAKEAEAALAADRRVADAVDEARRRPVTADDLGLRDPGGKPPPG